MSSLAQEGTKPKLSKPEMEAHIHFHSLPPAQPFSVSLQRDVMGEAGGFRLSLLPAMAPNKACLVSSPKPFYQFLYSLVSFTRLF